MVKSKFKYTSLIFPLLLIFSFGFGGIGAILYPFINGYYKTSNVDGRIFIGILLIVIAILIFISFVRSFYAITIFDEQILIEWINKQRIIPISEVKAIDLFCLDGHVWIFNPLTVIIKLDDKKIYFEDIDETIIVIADGMYKNIDEIISALKSKFELLINQQTTLNDNSKYYEEEVFKGNPYYSFSFWTFSIFIVLIVGMLCTTDINDVWPLFMPISFLIFLLVVDFFYFEIGNNKIIIRNHFAFWYKKEFYFEDIVMVDFYNPPRRSQSLRIVTKDRKIKYYSAGSLKEKNWTLLSKRLIQSKVKASSSFR